MVQFRGKDIILGRSILLIQVFSLKFFLEESLSSVFPLSSIIYFSIFSTFKKKML